MLEMVLALFPRLLHATTRRYNTQNCTQEERHTGGLPFFVYV